MKSFFALFTPKLITVLKEGYGGKQLRADMVAGLTVAIVALPLSMAIAIASGMTPAAGLYTAIIGGFFVSLLGGSRFQIGGPAGAFIVLVSTTVMQHGVDGLILATFLSGIMLIAVGFFRLGGFVKFIPFPVIVGFTAGIAVIIFVSQLRDFLGITLEKQPNGLVETLPALWNARESLTPSAVVLTLVTIILIFGIRRWRPQWPGMLIAVTLVTLVATWGKFPVTTIGSQFNGIPSTLPLPSFPELSWEKLWAVLPMAAAFTLLGSIESLLSAVVADGMTGRRHRSNCELVAQGVANMGAACFGGFCVTGTIARTATNIRARAQSPLSGIFHSLFLLLFILLAAPLAAFIPLAALAGVLTVVAWNMVDQRAIRSLLVSGKGEAMVLMVTLFLTVFRNLIEGIIAGMLLGSILFIRRMSQMTTVVSHQPFVTVDLPDEVAPRGAYDADALVASGVVVFKITGALFFGATAGITSLLDRVWGSYRALILDFSAVPFVDSSGANLIVAIAKNAKRQGVAIWLIGVEHPMRRTLELHELKPPLVRYAESTTRALHQMD